MQAMSTSEFADRREVAASAPRNGPRREDVPGLTGLRFAAAFSVLIAHSMSMLMRSHETPWGFVYWVIQASGFGMTLFFVLSGFVIHYNYATLVTEGRVRGIAAYLWARFARLYPLFLLALLCSALISIRFFEFLTGRPERFIGVLHALPYFLLSVQSWLYVPIGGSSLIYAIGGSAPLTWSISTEWFFYFLYPLVAWFLLRSRAPRFTILFIMLWCALWIVLSTGLYDRAAQIDAWAVARYGPIAEMREPQDVFAAQDSFVRWLLYFSPYLRMGEFVLGSLMAQLYIQLRGRKITAVENRAGTAVFFAAAASMFVITYLEYSPDVGENFFRKMNMNFALAPSAALLIFCAARYRNVVSRMLMSRPAIVLGDASYSTYLVHFGVLASVVVLAGAAVHGVVYDTVRLVLVMTAVLLISILLYSYYEAPARKWLRQLWGNRRPRAALAEAQSSSAS
jgi:peptidoglycan/LPS O-acetylase OafA/YrhL